jgi:hypothetical protein
MFKIGGIMAKKNKSSFNIKQKKNDQDFQKGDQGFTKVRNDDVTPKTDGKQSGSITKNPY